MLFKITNAPITPGIQPQKVNIKIIKKEPHPLSIMDNGGKSIANKTLNKLIYNFLLQLKDTKKCKMLQFKLKKISQLRDFFKFFYLIFKKLHQFSKENSVH